MRRAYDEIMERIEVTPEMRRRVLDRIAREGAVPPRPKVLRFPALKKYLSAAACLILVIAGAAALPRLARLLPPDEDVQMVPKMEEASSLDELSRMVGFEVKEGFALPFEPEETTYCSYWNELAQIRYSGAGQTAVFRQSAGTQDNSGDYTVYSASAELNLNGVPVTLKGDGGTYVLAVWTDGAYAYSLALPSGITQTEWIDVLGAR